MQTKTCNEENIHTLIHGIVYSECQYAGQQRIRDVMRLLKRGKLGKSRKNNFLKEVIKFDSETIDYPYEMAYAYYLRKGYKEGNKN